jgi:hypothetical protein
MDEGDEVDDEVAVMDDLQEMLLKFLPIVDWSLVGS